MTSHGAKVTNAELTWLAGEVFEPHQLLEAATVALRVSSPSMADAEFAEVFPTIRLFLMVVPGASAKRAAPQPATELFARVAPVTPDTPYTPPPLPPETFPEITVPGPTANPSPYNPPPSLLAVLPEMVVPWRTIPAVSE
jgi:hypothetical protein